MLCPLVIMRLVVCCCLSSLLWLRRVEAGPAPELVVIDTDPGIDDATAILATLGTPGIRLLALTCVRGNADVASVITNALKILYVAGRDKVAVYPGSDHGLLGSPTNDMWFGADGLGDLSLPESPSSQNVKAEHAASFLARTVQTHQGKVTIICLGPLTNIALALHLNPQFLRQAKRVIILGGSAQGQGNVAPGVEFNFHMDPHAAALVLERASASYTTLTLMPLETVSKNYITWGWRWKTLGKVNNSVLSFLNILDKWLRKSHSSTGYIPYDAYAAGVIISEKFVTSSQELYGWVVCEGSRSQGALLVDYSNMTGRSANLVVVTDLDVEALKSSIFNSLSSFA